MGKMLPIHSATATNKPIDVKTYSAQRVDINQMCKNVASGKMPENDRLIIYDGKLSQDDGNHPDSTQDNANTCLK